MKKLITTTIFTLVAFSMTAEARFTRTAESRTTDAAVKTQIQRAGKLSIFALNGSGKITAETIARVELVKKSLESLDANFKSRFEQMLEKLDSNFKESEGHEMLAMKLGANVNALAAIKKLESTLSGSEKTEVTQVREAMENLVTEATRTLVERPAEISREKIEEILDVLANTNPTQINVARVKTLRQEIEKRVESENKLEDLKSCKG